MVAVLAVVAVLVVAASGRIGKEVGVGMMDWWGVLF
jgi:hypothetical protein